MYSDDDLYDNLPSYDIAQRQQSHKRRAGLHHHSAAPQQTSAYEDEDEDEDGDGAADYYHTQVRERVHVRRKWGSGFCQTARSSTSTVLSSGPR